VGLFEENKPEAPGAISGVAVAVAIVTMAGSFLSALVGFAFALTTTSLLSNLLGSKVAQPLVAFLFLVNQIILIQRKGLGDWREMATLVLASIVTIPVGVMGLILMDAALGERLLGGLIIAYVLYTAADFALPSLQERWQTIATGLFAGITVGAFNIGGPWIAIYGQCRKWKAERFASNMVTYQAPTCVVTLGIHLFRGAFNDKVLWWYIALALPGMLIGARVGDYVATRIAEGVFKQLTLALIAIMGLRLLLATLSPTAGAVASGVIGCAVFGILLKRRREMGVLSEKFEEAAQHHSHDEKPLDELPTAHGATAWETGNNGAVSKDQTGLHLIHHAHEKA